MFNHAGNTLKMEHMGNTYAGNVSNHTGNTFDHVWDTFDHAGDTYAGTAINQNLFAGGATAGNFAYVAVTLHVLQ